MRVSFKSVLFTFWLAMTNFVTAEEHPAASVEFFENNIRPVLVESCYSCHSGEAGSSEGGLLLDSRLGLAAGGDTGPAIVAGSADESLLVRRILSESEHERMPPPDAGEPLSPDVIAKLKVWIDAGAVDPRGEVKPPPAKDFAAAREHWAFLPLEKPSLPDVDPAAQVVTPRVLAPIDHFVAAKHRELGITANAPADRRTLLRRITYDLTGLPPTYDEVKAFEADESTDAYDRVVDRLLLSETYGQRWGRFWLDVARYADTKGYLPGGAQLRFPFSYTYRDYVIDALNHDKPFREFIIEQIAADKLDLGDDRSPLAALGFLTLGRRFLNNQDDIIDDRIDVVTRGMLGLTVACARCHDHKFDPIPTADYYSLHGVFASSREPDEWPLIGDTLDSTRHADFVAAQLEIKTKIQAKTDELVDEFIAKHQPRETEYTDAAAAFALLAAGTDADKFAGERKLSGPLLRRFIDQVPDPANPSREDVANWIRRDINEKSSGLKRDLEALNWNHDGAPRRAMALVDSDHPHDSHILRRGRRGNEGDIVPRQFLEALSLDHREPFQNGSGRLELAQSIADSPLAARVFVNRVWGWHFGTPLVDTPSDLGVRTPPPLLADVLEWLSADFIEHGGSIKHLHRQIVMSSTYRSASDANPSAAAVDPENLSLFRFNRRRLEFEAMRDTMLDVSSALQIHLGGLPVNITDSPSPPRRTVYAYIDRQNLPGLFRTFDFPNPDASTPGRFRTTVPQQALYLLNSPFVAEQADRLASQVADVPAEDAVLSLYHKLFQRDPTAQETKLGVAFITDADAGKRSRYCQSLLLTNELMFVD